jgi:hypothetical protein
LKPVAYLINTKDGLQGEPGIFYSYIMASNGLFIRSKNDFLSVTVCLALQEIRGLAPLQEEIWFLHGKPSLHLLELALSVLCMTPDCEKYIAIVWEGEYKLKETTLEAGPGHVNYENLDNAVIDIHSHTGDMPAKFSIIDDHDEKGFRLYVVVAGLRTLFPTVTIRLGIYGYYLDLEKGETFE